MARKCPVTNKRPLTGCKVSHANNKTKRRSLPNLFKKKLWLEEEKRFVTIKKLSAKGLRTIDRKGLAAVLKSISK